jgi:Protein of unknwon function (DUF3310)
MKYFFELHRNGHRINTFERFEEIKFVPSDCYIAVYDLTKPEGGRLIGTIFDDNDLLMWQTRFEREYAWKPEVDTAINPCNEIVKNYDKLYKEYQERNYDVPATGKIDHINPRHYKEIVPGMQYMEMMQYMLRDVESHLMGQIYKYLMRNGKKDDEIRDLEKSKWYLDFLIAYKKNGKPITIEQIHKILGAEAFL